VTYADGSVDTFTCDALGRRSGASNANASLTYSYDALNRIIAVANATARFTTTYAYDASGNRTKLSTFAQNSSSPYAVAQYTYDAKNRLTAINDSILGGFNFTFAGARTGERFASGCFQRAAKRAGSTYDAMDRRTSLKYSNGVTTSYDYDKGYRITAIAAKDSLGNVIDAWSYQYDAVGNRTSKTDMAGKSELYTYDSVYRLKQASYADGSMEKFNYDAAGNRLSRSADGGTTANYTYDVANQLLTAGADTFTYDGNGNMVKKVAAAGTTTVTYGLRDLPTNITSPSGGETNTYGPNGERTWMAGASIEGGNVFPQYDISGNVHMDLNGSLNPHTYRVYGPGADEALAEYRAPNDRRTWLHHDALGSVTAVTNTTGQVAYRSTYKAFGEMSRTGYDLPTTRMGFTSRETSVGGLMQYRSRYYDPAQGRFLQKDSYGGNTIEPPSLHRYVYVINNPVRYTDPTGMSPNDEQMLAAYGGDTDMLQFILLSGIIFVGLVAILAVLWPLIAESVATLVTWVRDMIIWLQMTVEFMVAWLTTVTWHTS
jgi:RHS repeat-associated protein